MADRYETERFIWALARAKGDLSVAHNIAVENRLGDRVVSVLRSAVAAGSTLDPDSDDLIDRRTMTAGFVDELRSLSLVMAIYADTVRPGFHTQVNFATAGFAGGVITDGALKILSKMTLADGGKLTPNALVSVGFFTDELLRVMSPGTLASLRTAMAGAVATAVDAYGIARLLDGVVVSASSGDPLTDAYALLSIVNTKGAGRHRWAMTPDVANQLSTLRDGTGKAPAFPTMTPQGGTFVNLPVTVTDQLPVDSAGQVGLMLVDATGVAAEVETAPRFAVATAAALDVEDTSNGGAASVLSLFQTNSVAIRAEMLAAVTRFRATSVAAVADCSYIGT